MCAVWDRSWNEKRTTWEEGRLGSKVCGVEVEVCVWSNIGVGVGVVGWRRRWRWLGEGI